MRCYENSATPFEIDTTQNTTNSTPKYSLMNPIQLHIQTIGNLNSLKKYKEESTLILLSKVYLCSCSYGFINEYFRVEFVVFCVVSIEKGVALFA